MIEGDATGSGIKSGLRAVLTARIFSPLWRLFTRDAVTILMLHRFEDPDLGVRGHSRQRLATNLEYLRRERFHLCSLPDLVTRLASGAPPIPRTVVFTVDDGYADFARIGAPLFSRYDCPATVFLVTGFVDRECWLWYDAFRSLCGDERVGDLMIGDGTGRLRLSWSSHEERDSVVSRTIEQLKGLPTAVVENAVGELAQRTGRQLAKTPTPEFSALSWGEARALETKGFTFGPHTHTHPILSRADDARSRHEITHSWNRLRSELRAPAPIFCYPNGMTDDVGERERSAVRAAGLFAGVEASGGACTLARFLADPYALPRASYEEEQSAFRKTVGGLERATQMVRDRSRG